MSSFRVIIELDDNYQLDLRSSEFGNLLGFDAKLLTETEYGSRFPNITNSIDKIVKAPVCLNFRRIFISFFSFYRILRHNDSPLVIT